MCHLRRFSLFGQRPDTPNRFVDIAAINKVITSPSDLITELVMLCSPPGLVHDFVVKILMFDDPVANLLRCSGTAQRFERFDNRFEPLNK